MEWLFLVVALAALACPVTMLAPMLLRRLGIRRGGAARSCGRMSHDQKPALDTEALRARRAELDREMASLATHIRPEVVQTGRAGTERGPYE